MPYLTEATDLVAHGLLHGTGCPYFELLTEHTGRCSYPKRYYQLSRWPPGLLERQMRAPSFIEHRIPRRCQGVGRSCSVKNMDLSDITGLYLLLVRLGCTMPGFVHCWTLGSTPLGQHPVRAGNCGGR